MRFRHRTGPMYRKGYENGKSLHFQKYLLLKCPLRLTCKRQGDIQIAVSTADRVEEFLLPGFVLQLDIVNDLKKRSKIAGFYFSPRPGYGILLEKVVKQAVEIQVFRHCDL